MLSKQVNDILKLINSLLAIAAWIPQLVVRIVARLRPALRPGEEPFDVALLVAQLLESLRLEQQRLTQADEAHTLELADDLPFRDTRDVTSAALSGSLVAIRRSAEGNYGPSVLVSLGLDQAVPKDPLLLTRTAATVLKVIEQENFRLPAPLPCGAAVDPAAWANQLREPLAACQQALADVARENREASETLLAKNQAIAEALERYRKTADLLAALCAYAGLDDLADRVRPTVRRTRGEEPPAPLPDPTAEG